ncbi:MAG: DUF6702 family protein [Flavobacteriales bacterium]|nr:DUF6702 family protein [Flavobacteriales bacterium]
MRWTLLFLLPFLAFTLHKYYVSNTVIEHNIRTQSLEIVIKVFADDFEMALGGTEKNPLRLGDEREVPNANQLIEEYIITNFKVELDDRPTLLHFIGKEIEGEQVVCYAEIYSVVDFKVLTVFNTLLVNKYHGQKNIVDLHAAGWSKTEVLTEEKTTVAFFK